MGGTAAGLVQLGQRVLGIVAGNSLDFVNLRHDALNNLSST